MKREDGYEDPHWSVGSGKDKRRQGNNPGADKKVPSRLSEKAKIASNTVQLLNSPRLSVAAREWISAVHANQGMNEAFSTGSQNHQPPQPNS